MKTLVLATLLVAPTTMADVLPVRLIEDRIGIQSDSFVLLHKSGREYTVKTNCDMDKVMTFKTRSRAIREGTVVRISKDETCRVEEITEIKQ